MIMKKKNLTFKQLYVGYHKVQYVNDLYKASNIIKPIMFADMIPIFSTRIKTSTYF